MPPSATQLISRKYPTSLTLPTYLVGRLGSSDHPSLWWSSLGLGEA